MPRKKTGETSGSSKAQNPFKGIPRDLIPYVIYYGLNQNNSKSAREILASILDGNQSNQGFPARVVTPESSESGIIKTAQSDGSGDVTFFPPRWFSPMLSWVHFYMPTDLKTTLTWVRHWDTFHPLVGNAIDLHSLLTLGKFQLKLDGDPVIRRIYEEAWEACGGILFLYDIIREYYLTGEVFYYMKFDDETGIFIDAIPLPPEDIYVDKDTMYEYGREVQFKLQVAQRDFNPEMNSLDKFLLEKAPIDVIEAINRNEPIPLPNQFLFVIQRKQSAYQLRGTSLVLRVMKDLLYEDKIREAQYAIAQRHINPKEIWKVGSDTFPATQQQIDTIADMIRTAEQNPLFTMVTTHTVSAEYLFGNQGLSPLKDEFDWIENRVLSAMFTNKAIVHGEGPTYANATVAYRAMMARYVAVRALIERALMEKFFKPIAELHGFYKATPAELVHNIQRPFAFRELVLPQIDWGGTKSSIFEGRDVFQTAKSLREMGIPMKTILEYIGDFDYDTILKQKKEEEGTPFDPLYEKWREQYAQTLPAPVHTSSVKETFKVPVMDVDTGEIKELELSWPNSQRIMAKAKIASAIEKLKKEGKPIPLQNLFGVIKLNK